MNLNGYDCSIDCATKFHKSLYVAGWLRHPDDHLVSVCLSSPDLTSQEFSVGLVHPGVDGRLGTRLGFTVQALFKDEADPSRVHIEFSTRKGHIRRVSLSEIVSERLSQTATHSLYSKFKQELKARGAKTILDIGGRARSRIDRRNQFDDMNVTVFDIADGKNVDVVGDAHELTKHFSPGVFDAVLSVSVFEHLLMPWKVAIEISRVLRPTGIGFIHTHQTIGLHDMPWDYWRFSADAWDGLFNWRTGFTIMGRAMDQEQFVLPFLYQERKRDAERSAGFEGSAVLFEKSGESTLAWDTSLAELITTHYPTGQAD